MSRRVPSPRMLSSAALAVMLLGSFTIPNRPAEWETPPNSALVFAAETKSPAGTAPVREPKRGGNLTVATEWDISTLNPYQKTFSVDEYVRDVMYDALLSVDLKDNVQPHLAESWEVSRDGRLYTFKLRKGVKFHDGKEMTAEDVSWSINFILNPKNAAYGKQRILMVDRAEVVDRYTLRVYLNQSHAGFLAALTQIKAGLVTQKGALEGGTARVDTFPPGTGPFRFVEWQQKQRIVFERFSDYWGEHRAAVDRVIFRPLLDDSVRLTALRAGDVDLIRGVPYDWTGKIERGEIKGLVGIKAVNAQTKQLAFNVLGAPFENLKLRQAVAHAINREEIVEGVFGGSAAPMDVQTYPKSHKWYLEGVPTQAFDPEKARRLLKEAGYKGEEVELLLTNASEDQSTAQVIQGQLRRVGMNVNLKIVDVAVREDFSKRGQYQFDLRGGNFYPDLSDSYVPHLACDEKRISNRTGYCDKSVDDLLVRADSELNEGKRRELYKQVMIKAYDALPYVRLVFVHKPFAFHDYVKGFTVDREGRFRWAGGGVNGVWLDK